MPGSIHPPSPDQCCILLQTSRVSAAGNELDCFSNAYRFRANHARNEGIVANTSHLLSLWVLHRFGPQSPRPSRVFARQIQHVRMVVLLSYCFRTQNDSTVSA